VTFELRPNDQKAASTSQRAASSEVEIGTVGGGGRKCGAALEDQKEGPCGSPRWGP
jgi:hypothetical protein